MSNILKIRINSLPFEDQLIVDAFRANQLVIGPHVEIFEKGLADCFYFSYASTVSTGFAALFLALKSLKLEKARVIVPAISTCQAMTNAVLANGFEVVFCKIAPDHLSLDESALTELFSSNSFDVIIAPSHFGIPAPIEFYKKFGAPVIEDACQAFYTRTVIRSPADIMVLSFYPTKQFNCIEGGAILYNNPEYVKTIEDLRYYDHQLNFDGQSRYNLRMVNLHAAFGCLALKNIDQERRDLLKRRDNYIMGIKNKQLLLTAQSEESVVPWRFLIKSHELELFERLTVAGIQTDREMLLLQNFKNSINDQEWIDAYRSIPYFSTLKYEEQKFIIQNING